MKTFLGIHFKMQNQALQLKYGLIDNNSNITLGKEMQKNVKFNGQMKIIELGKVFFSYNQY